MNNYDKVKQFMQIAGQNQTTKNLENEELTQFRIELIEEEVNELKEAIKTKNKTEVIDALADILYVVYGAGKTFEIGLNKAFDIVHKSNMTKFCKTEQEANDTVLHYKQLKNSPYDSPEYKKVNDYFVVFNKSSGKILKNINYTPTDFTTLS